MIRTSEKIGIQQRLRAPAVFVRLPAAELPPRAVGVPNAHAAQCAGLGRLGAVGAEGRSPASWAAGSQPNKVSLS